MAMEPLPGTCPSTAVWRRNGLPIWKMRTAQRGLIGPLSRPSRSWHSAGIECDPAEFWAALNMIYSDYVKVAKKFNVGSNIDFYVDMAKAFLDDKDAGPDKLAKYYQYVVR